MVTVAMVVSNCQATQLVKEKFVGSSSITMGLVET